jgi:uncharacterized protein YyaL (SSP411 family)
MISAGVKKHTNRLGGETSPYLRQHADNPVDWYPWCDEAFERARDEGKPVFLSIGYSTCHWCHVMAHESFEDRDIAKLLNEGFVSIKVDREERPDIDAIYMRACQVLTGSGGWPLTIIMTPERRPFFAATYVPKFNSYGRAGLMELLPRVRDMWASRRSDVMGSADEISSFLQGMGNQQPAARLEEADLQSAFEVLRASFDRSFGGFGNAPKFPNFHNLTFLMRFHRRTGNEEALAMVVRTLDAMRAGGICDHVGGGFHRYSVDSQWRVPHFEKMLYDQAGISMAYVEAWQVTARQEFRAVAEQTLEYVLRDLATPDDMFYSAEDADSEGGEGAFYLWRMKELEKILDKDELALVAMVFGAKDGGNAGGEVAIGGEPANVLHMDVPLEEVAQRRSIDPTEFTERYDRVMEKLGEARRRRPRPSRDEKVLADWNGLIVAALAKAGSAFGELRYIEIARRAADSLLSKLRDDEGRLVHCLRGKADPIGAFAEDYAFVIWGLIELYEACLDPRYLREAIALNDELMTRYFDEGAGLFTTPFDGEDLPARFAEGFDGATPSANSVHARNLVMLSRITGEVKHERQAQTIMDAFASQVRAQPIGHTNFLNSLDCLLGPYLDVVVAGDRDAASTSRMLRALKGPYAPDMLLILRDERAGAESIRGMGSFVGKCESIEGRAAAYICRGRSCMPPTTDVDEALAALRV